MGKNVIISEADITSSVNVYNKNKDILVLGEGPTQRLDDTTLTTETKDPITFTQPRKRFVLSLHYNESNNSYLLMQQKYINSKEKTLK